ncbi:Arb2 domain-containing protein [Venturia nashicola]|nr:Arb2 domain-containing protein [Venturia nashicola]
MFRRLPASLPPDAAFKSDLKELGYFINDKSQIMQIKHPDRGYVFKIYNDERYNIMHREALHDCIRKEVLDRTTAAGLSLLYLPQLSTVKPNEPHVPIFTTPPADLKHKKRIVVVLNDHRQDLGIWDYRYLSINGIDSASSVNLAKLVQQDGEDMPGLIISNAGQLTYSHKKGRAMTTQSWQGMPRSSLAYPVVQEDPFHNSAEGTRDRFEHCHFIFEKILKNTNLVREDAEIYLVGVLNGGEVALKYLNANWDSWKSRIKAVALTSVFTKRQTLSWELIQFLRDRARNWKISGAPKDACLVSPLHWTLSIPDTILTQPPDELEPQLRKKEEVDVGGHSHANDLVKATPADHDGEELTEWAVPEKKMIPDAQIICPEFSSSVQDFTEVIFPTVLESVLTFFKDVQKDVKDYKNPTFMVEDHEEEPLEVEADADAANDEDAATTEGVEMMTLEEFEKKEKGGGEKKEVRFVDEKEDEEKKKKKRKEGDDQKEAKTSEMETIRVAGVDLEETMLKAAGLM